ncbi:MAG: prepilin-type N-terminal cleavage/methylation domain-containing protein [Candidatus Pacebacteria bacterium]|nr:prepilin-type N-terminal cleavage/methylation domain-containing protein [Candidatus Paceibacterota bacterium]MDD5555094.1 prepilin-type N-terminal cleavage/methylation domain-containing protein [Candidatus Paceibacterota bacterium]
MHKSFTLIEILVVIVIVGIISAFIIVSMSGVSDKARIAKGQAFSNSLKNSLLMNLVSEWRLDDASGTTAQDQWGANTGTWYGAGGGNYTSPSWRTSSECVSGGCLAFDGTDDYVDCGSDSSLDITDAITIAGWFYRIGPNIRAYTEDWIGKRSGGSKYVVSGTSSAKLVLSVDGVQDTTATHSVPISSNTWTYLAYTYNSSTATGRAYKNSLQYGEDFVLSGKTSYKIDSFPAVTLKLSSSAYTVNGKLDDVRIYNSVIPTSRIQQNYYSGLSRLLVNKIIDSQEYVKRLALGEN